MVVVEASVMDPTHLELSHPIDLPPGSKVVVSVMDSNPVTNDHDPWTSLALGGLAGAYGANEPEYGSGSIRQPNPEFEG